MLKTLLFSVALIAGTSTIAVSQTTVVHHKKNRILANGRCNGVSYGTGARSCGTKTGGPVGGSAGRN